MIIPINIKLNEERKCVKTFGIIFEKLGDEEQPVVLSISIQPEWLINAPSWGEQFRTVCNIHTTCNRTGPIFCIAFYIFVAPWRFLFSFVPPAPMCCGWLCLLACSVMMGMMYALVGDLAELLGCVLALPAAVTANFTPPWPFIFAALVLTQMPDADASLLTLWGFNVANISVGFGFPWLLGVFYWKFVGSTEEWVQRYPHIARSYPDGGFVIHTENLLVNVLTSVCFAVVVFLIFVCRRTVLSGEFGGPPVWRYATSVLLLLLWIGVIVYTAWV